MLKILNKLVIPAILVATVMVAGMFAFMPVNQASTVHTEIITDLATVTAQPAVLTLASTALADNNQIEIACGATAASDKDVPFVVTMLTLRTTLDGGDDFDIDSIEIDNIVKTSGDAATLTAINVNAGAITSDPFIVPLSIDSLGANGELDLIIDENAGDISDDTVTGTAVILVRSDATCSFTTGAND